jgi:hypothetical protein
MGALSNDGPDDEPREKRIGPPIKLTYERWHHRMPPNPPEWSRMGPHERAEWEKARELVEKLRLTTHEMRARGLLDVDPAYWVNLW